MENKEEKCIKNAESANDISQVIPIVSKVIFDEKTGTITLKLANEEEIAQNTEK